MPSPGPTSSPRCTSVLPGRRPTWSRPTASAPSPCRSASTSIPERAHEINLAVGPDRPRGGRRSHPAAASWPGRWARAPSRRRWARSASPTCATPTRCRPAASSRAASTCSSSRPSSTCWRAKAAVIGARRAMAALGRRSRSRCRSPSSRPARMLLGTEIGAALAALERAASPTSSASTAPPAPTEMREHLRHLSANATHADLVPAQRRPALGGRRQDALRPQPGGAGRVPDPVRHRARACRSSAAAAAPRPSTCASSPAVAKDLTPARRQPRPRARRHLDLQRRARSTRTPAS